MFPELKNEKYLGYASEWGGKEDSVSREDWGFFLDFYVCVIVIKL